MKQLAKIALMVGIASLVVGILLRLASAEIMLGLIPSSFLELSAVCFLLVIAINTTGKAQ